MFMQFFSVILPLKYKFIRKTTRHMTICDYRFSNNKYKKVDINLYFKNNTL